MKIYTNDLVKGHSDFKVKCLTFGLYTQVSDSGPLGPLVYYYCYKYFINVIIIIIIVSSTFWGILFVGVRTLTEAQPVVDYTGENGYR